MKAWELEDVRRAVKGKWVMRGGGVGRPFNGVICTDSRKAAAGDLFFAIAGERHDAHKFVGEVIEREVAAVVVHKELSPQVLGRARAMNVSVILVEETVAALNRLAAAYRQQVRA